MLPIVGGFRKSGARSDPETNDNFNLKMEVGTRWELGSLTRGKRSLGNIYSFVVPISSLLKKEESEIIL